MELPETPEDLYVFEAIARKEGFECIVGIDEAGRGPLAGPVVAAAVSLPPRKRFKDLNDSKQLSEVELDSLYYDLTNDKSVQWSVAVIDAAEIDRINILNASCEAMRMAASEIAADFIFVDGNPVSYLPAPSQNDIKGDAKVACIAAASVIAKVHRDNLMMDYHTDYPEYGFFDHKGYGTPVHLAALKKHGPCPLHRRSFGPVKKIISDSLQGELDLEL